MPNTPVQVPYHSSWSFSYSTGTGNSLGGAGLAPISRETTDGRPAYPASDRGRVRLTQRLIEEEPERTHEGGPPRGPLSGRRAGQDQHRGRPDVNGQPNYGDQVGGHPQREQIHNPKKEE